MADDELTEALLEMHYHRALVALFAEHFGRKVIRLLKPSPQREAMLGFDQGWVHTEIPLTHLRKQLQEAIAAGSRRVDSLYVGYFMQFKRVVRAKQKPKDPRLQQYIQSVPFFKSELDLKPNKLTRRSQHETLLNLSKIARCDVNYACPMVFDVDSIYEDPNLDLLRLVPLASAPGGYLSTERHFICFQNERSPPIWCSDPVEGEAFSPPEWIKRDQGYLRLNADGLLSLLTQLLEAGLSERELTFGHGPLLPPSLTLLEFGT